MRDAWVEIFSRSITKLVTDCSFVGGCAGNTKGIASLVKGMHRDEVIARLKGIKCGFKNTSCPDQLARALEENK